MTAIMKNTTTATPSLISLAALLMLAFSSQVRAQTPVQQPPAEPGPAQAQVNQPNQVQDLFSQLNLTPEQVQKIRTINDELKDERQVANLRLRLAQRALTVAIESPTPDEKLIEQRSKEVAEAQAVTIRLRSLTEARVRQVLTPEQRTRLKEIRERNQALRRQNQQNQRNGQGQRQSSLQRGTNPPPLGPNQRRIMRQPPRR